MTKEQIYKGILEYVNTLDENDQKVINRAVEAEQTMNNGRGVFILADILIGLKADIRADYAKANGSTNSFKAAMEIIKAAKKKPQTALHGAWFADGEQYVCDGYRALHFYEPLDLPIIPKDAQPMNIKQIFSGIEQNQNEYPVPTIGNLKAFITLEKAKPRDKADKKQGIYYDAGETHPLVNAEYLLTMITALDDCKIYHGIWLYGAMYCKGTNGEGILLPVRRYPSEIEPATGTRLTYEQDGKFYVRGQDHNAVFDTWDKAKHDFERINAMRNGCKGK